MRTFIQVSDGLRRDLMRKFTLSKVSIWSALNYLTFSERAKSVRRYALANGGRIVEQDFLPNCSIQHTTEEIIHSFPGEIVVRINRKTSNAKVFQNGKEIESYEQISLDSWGNLLFHAQELSEQRIAEAAKK